VQQEQGRSLHQPETKTFFAIIDRSTQGNRIAVRFTYEWHDDSGNWFRSYGNENWDFDANGLMHQRIASINDLPIMGSERKYHWPFGHRPDDYLTLSDLGF